MSAAGKLLSLALDIVIFAGGVGLTVSLVAKVTSLITEYFNLIL